jgi:DNA-binding NarL/FixJ family response regulator
MTTKSFTNPRCESKLPDQDIRVAVLDDHVVVRYGIELLMEHTPGYQWTGAASTPAELLRLLISTPCHVLVLDYQLSPGDLDGWSLVRHLRAHFPHLRILVYTAHASPAITDIMRRAGVHGFIPKSAGLDCLLDALRWVASGTAVFPSCPLAPAEPSDAIDRLALSPREHEVLRCCRQGMSVTAIAAKFHRSVKTISAQKQAAFRKLGVRNDHDFVLMIAHAKPGSVWTLA